MTTPEPMDSISIDTSADFDFFYEGMSRQSIDFHQAIAELIDNAISAMSGPYFTIEILLQRDGDNVEVTVADEGNGISREDLQDRVLKIGGRGSRPGALNEHGFGLKNSLLLLAGHRIRPFAILTADREAAAQGKQWVVEGPFEPGMTAHLVNDERWQRNLSQCTGSRGTRIVATTTLEYMRSLYQRASTLPTLATRLAEHLGVFYRHWLASDRRNQIWVRWREGNGEWRDIVVPPIGLPLGDDHESFSVDVEVDGVRARVQYVVGELDPRKLENDEPPFPLQIYYQHTEKTQGVDVVVRNKVILTNQLERLWPDQIRRRERNYFLGELTLEGDAFATVHNKTDLDPHNPFWIKVREQFNERPELLPAGYQIGRTEAVIREHLKEILEQVVGASRAQTNYPVWSGAGIKADIVHFGPEDGWLDVYELKDERASPQDVYQLIMYWDGLVTDGKSPRRGILVAESAPGSVLNLLAHWNRRKDLRDDSYQVEFKKVSDLGIRVVRPRRTGTRRRIRGS